MTEVGGIFPIKIDSDNFSPELFWEYMRIRDEAEQMTKLGEKAPLTPYGLQQAQKHDDGKPRLDYLDPYALEEVAKVLTFGAAKYGAWNWKKGIESGRLLAACLRHVFAFMRGEENDPETGLSHLAHAMCCLMFLIWMQKHRRDLDDRFMRGES